MNKAFFYWKATTSKLSLFARHPSALYFYVRYYLEDLRRPPVDVSVVSFPKSGRTWLEAMLVEVARLHLGEPREYKTWREMRHDHPELPVIWFTHAGSSWESWINDENDIRRIPLEPFAKGRVLFVHRDPRDVLVSAYHHMRHRTGVAKALPEDMITNKVVGLRKLLRFMNRWRTYVEAHPEGAARMSYEAMRADPEAALTQVCAFAGLEVPPEVVAQAVERTRFERMQQKERSGGGGNPWMMPRDPKNIGSYKVRSGKVGEYRSLFEPEQIDRIDAILTEELDPAFGYEPSPRDD